MRAGSSKKILQKREHEPVEVPSQNMQRFDRVYEMRIFELPLFLKLLDEEVLLQIEISG